MIGAKLKTENLNLNILNYILKYSITERKTSALCVVCSIASVGTVSSSRETFNVDGTVFIRRIFLEFFIKM